MEILVSFDRGVQELSDRYQIGYIRLYTMGGYCQKSEKFPENGKLVEVFPFCNRRPKIGSATVWAARSHCEFKKVLCKTIKS